MYLIDWSFPRVFLKPGLVIEHQNIEKEKEAKDEG